MRPDGRHQAVGRPPPQGLGIYIKKRLKKKGPWQGLTIYIFFEYIDVRVMLKMSGQLKKPSRRSRCLCSNITAATVKKPSRNFSASLSGKSPALTAPNPPGARFLFLPGRPEATAVRLPPVPALAEPPSTGTRAVPGEFGKESAVGRVFLRISLLRHQGSKTPKWCIFHR